MDVAFINALREPARARCMGVSLVPLTLGHFFLLREYGSAFVSGDEATVEDLILGCFVCCQDAASSRRSLRSILLPFVMRLWGRRARKCNVVLELMTFRKYIRDGTAAPAVVISHGAGESMRELMSPLEWRLLVMLRHDFGMSKTEAMGTRMDEANALWATLGDRDGKINLMSETTRMLIDAQAQNREGN